MKKKILISLLVALLLVCAVAVGVFATDSTTTEFAISKAQLNFGVDLRFKFKVQTGTLPEGADVKLLVWEGAADGVDYTQATKDTTGYTELTNPIIDEKGLLVFTYDGITAAEMGKTLYLRAYYNDGTEDVYTEAKRYSMAQYLHSIYKAEGTTEKENKVIETLFAYGDAAQELVLNPDDKLTLPKISDGVVEVTVAGGKFADGFTAGKFLAGEKLSVVADSAEITPTLTAALGDDFCWANANGYYGYANKVNYAEGIFVDAVSNYSNIFEVTVDGETDIYTEKNLSEVFALANVSAVKLLANVDMGNQCIFLQNGVTITLDLNGKKITSTIDYPFYIYDAKLTVNDSAGNGSITTTGLGVFFINNELSILEISGGTFESKYYAVNVNSGTVTIENGTFTSEYSAVSVYGGTVTIENGTFTSEYSAVSVYGGTVTINGGTFSADTAVYVEDGEVTIENGAFESEYSAVHVNGGKVTIENGAFTGTSYVVHVNGCELTIEDGTFTGNLYVNKENSTISITGGTFNTDPSDYVDKTAATVTNNDDNTWTVTATSGEGGSESEGTGSETETNG